MEDVAVLSALFEKLVANNEATNVTDRIEAVFAAFEANRRERDQWLVQSSRHASDVYEWNLPQTGRDYFEAMQKDIAARQAVCWGVDLDKAVVEAKADLRRRLGVTTK